MGQIQTAEKSNEITAIPALLEALDISGCIITIDAMGCQKTVARAVAAQHGDYTLALKENHPKVYAEAQKLFAGINEPSCSFPHAAEVTKDRGRIEKREARLCTSWFAGLAAWAGLTAVGCIRSRRTVKGAAATELRYYLTTLADAAVFARPVRTHWGIENKPHWILDVVFREDYARNRKDRSAANLAIIRKITLNLP